MKPVINSLLDQDLYKFTMGSLIFFGNFAGVKFQDIDVEYEFINRSNRDFPAGFGDKLIKQIELTSQLRFTDDELRFLSGLRFIKRGFVDFLAGYKWNPDHIKVSQKGSHLAVKISGPWYETTYYEVPLMAMISELFFRDEQTPDTERVRGDAITKGEQLTKAGCIYSDFGTRRRFSFDVQDTVVDGLRITGGLAGTSNVLFAKKYGLTPIGTHAHELFMANAALFGYRLANRNALEAWVNEYDGDLGIALTDTFTTKAFFDQFSMKLAKLFDGVRHDSGDPIEFAKMCIAHYEKLRINPTTKTIVFSDGLTTDKAIEIHDWCKGKIRTAFGIGTHFTNDVGVKPLNIVIKMVKCNGIPVVKLSDEPGKHTGDARAIEFCKYSLGL